MTFYSFPRLDNLVSFSSAAAAAAAYKYVREFSVV